MNSGRTLRAVAISGSPSLNSRSRILILRALALLEAAGVETSSIDLSDLPADALLARRRDPAVDSAIGEVAASNVIILGTPIYRATYAGQLKAFFDLFPQEALLGRVVGFVATGAGPGHLLMIDHGLRPLVASLHGLSAAQAVYVVDSQFPDKQNIPEPIEAQLRALADELLTLAAALARDPSGVAG
jgi:FMN reductase